METQEDNKTAVVPQADVELGMSVGVKFGDSNNWYRVHSLNRRPSDGAMCVFALDEQRTIFIIPAKKFAGAGAFVRDFNGTLHPDILESKEMLRYKVN